VRSLLPGSNPSTYCPLSEISGPRIDFCNVSAEVKKQVHSLELGKAPVPTLLVSPNYVLIDRPENIQNFLVCRIAAISAVYITLLQDGPEVLLPRSNSRNQVTRVFLDDNQLELPQEEQEEDVQEEEEPEDEPFEEEEDLDVDPGDDQP
jgi:hypothetical protein